ADPTVWCVGSGLIDQQLLLRLLPRLRPGVGGAPPLAARVERLCRKTRVAHRPVTRPVAARPRTRPNARPPGRRSRHQRTHPDNRDLTSERRTSPLREPQAGSALVQQVHERWHCQKKSELGRPEKQAQAHESKHTDHSDGPRRVEAQLRQRYVWRSWQANITLPSSVSPVPYLQDDSQP